MIKVYIPFFKIHIVEVIVDVGSWEALLSLVLLFSLQLFDKSSLWIKMTSIQGWRMPLHLSSIRSSGGLECFITAGYSLTHAFLSTHESFFLMTATVTHLWSVSGQEITCCCFLWRDQRQSRFGSLLLTCSFTHKTHLRYTDGKRGKRGERCFSLERKGLRGLTALKIQYF